MALVDDAVANLGGDPKRVSVAGQSMGGAGAWLFASKQPDRFCAVVPICGYIPDDVMPSVVEALKAKPIWLFSSEEDDHIPPPGQPQDDPEVVITALAGNANFKSTRYPLGTKPQANIPGHVAFALAFSEEGLWPWLAAQSL
mmetsp:Transcript_26830/g.71070  ORF Transcript_26830/g.71070 Transcript_26830/m.71070 type:complete len:142 (+) Transcript_26830:3-428(+)